MEELADIAEKTSETPQFEYDPEMWFLSCVMNYPSNHHPLFSLPIDGRPLV